MTATAPTGRPTDSTDADEVVRSPLFALQAREIDNAFELLADDVAYINVSLPTNSRSRPSRAPLQCTREMAAGFRVHFHTVATSGNTALTEPTVAIILGPVEQRIWSTVGSRSPTARSHSGGTPSTASTCSSASFAASPEHSYQPATGPGVVRTDANPHRSHRTHARSARRLGVRARGVRPAAAALALGVLYMAGVAPTRPSPRQGARRDCPDTARQPWRAADLGSTPFIPAGARRRR